MAIQFTEEKVKVAGRDKMAGLLAVLNVIDQSGKYTVVCKANKAGKAYVKVSDKKTGDIVLSANLNDVEFVAPK